MSAKKLLEILKENVIQGRKTSEDIGIDESLTDGSRLFYRPTRHFQKSDSEDQRPEGSEARGKWGRHPHHPKPEAPVAEVWAEPTAPSAHSSALRQEVTNQERRQAETTRFR